MGFGDRYTGRGILRGANLGRAIITNGDFTAYVCDIAATRPSSQITLASLFVVVIVIIIIIKQIEKKNLRRQRSSLIPKAKEVRLNENSRTDRMLLLCACMPLQRNEVARASPWRFALRWLYIEASAVVSGLGSVGP